MLDRTGCTLNDHAPHGAGAENNTASEGGVSLPSHAPSISAPADRVLPPSTGTPHVAATKRLKGRGDDASVVAGAFRARETSRRSAYKAIFAVCVELLGDVMVARGAVRSSTLSEIGLRNFRPGPDTTSPPLFAGYPAFLSRVTKTQISSSANTGVLFVLGWSRAAESRRPPTSASPH